MSLLTVDEFEELIKTGENPAILQDVIDREEAELAHALGSPLVGERVETYRPGVGYDGPLYLRRFADTVVVTDAGSTVTVVRLIDGGAIERTTGPWQGTVTVTYTPNDELRVKRALIELVRMVVVPERDREAGSDRPGSSAAYRKTLIRALQPRLGTGTMRVRTTDRVTPVLPLP